MDCNFTLRISRKLWKVAFQNRYPKTDRIRLVYRHLVVIQGPVSEHTSSQDTKPSSKSWHWRFSTTLWQTKRWLADVVSSLHLWHGSLHRRILPWKSLLHWRVCEWNVRVKRSTCFTWSPRKAAKTTNPLVVKFVKSPCSEEKVSVQQVLCKYL